MLFPNQTFKDSGAIVNIYKEYTYPASLGLGFEYRPRNEIPVRISLEWIQNLWSKFKDSRIEDLRFKNTNEFHLGVEHFFSVGGQNFEPLHLPLRFGFAYIPSYLNRDINQVLVSLGAGYELFGGWLNLGVAYGRRTYKNTEVCPSSDPLTIDESLIKVIVTISRTM
ncbi:MAG: hypothetical protein AB1393_02440 [Candidatus Edwardsbacteria bacterium]